MFAAASRRRRGWVLWIGVALLTLMLAGGWIGRGGPVRHDAAGRRFLEGRQARARSRFATGRSIVRVPTPSPRFGIPGRGLLTGAVARSVPDPVHGTSRNRGLRAGTGRRWSPACAAASRGASARNRPSSAPPRALPALERVFHMMVRDGDAGSLEQLHRRPRRAQGRGSRSSGVCCRGRSRATFPRALIQDLIVTFDDRIYPAHGRRVGTSARRRWRWPVHDLAVELARSPGRRPIPGRRLRQSRGPRSGLSSPVRQPVRHDVFERVSSGRPPSPDGGRS